MFSYPSVLASNAAMLTVTQIEAAPLHQIVYQYAAAAGALTTGTYAIYRAHAADAGTSMAALFLTSDLQGFEPAWLVPESPRSLGETVAEELALLGELG